MPRWHLTPAEPITPPAGTDCNTPLFWQGDTLYEFNSHGRPERSHGPSFSHMGNTLDCTWDGPPDKTWWIESVWFDAEDGLLYGWYHHEPAGLVPGTNLTAPLIGLVTSRDLGATWHDEGYVLENPYPINPTDDNGYFVGGNGDFCVILDEPREYFWFFFSTYAGPIEAQGIAVARSRFTDRGRPGTVVNYYQGEWNQPGLRGYSTPLFPTPTGWHGSEVFDCPWGPSVHWNTYLQQYVMLFNRTVRHGWAGEQYDISFSDDLLHWSAPEIFYQPGGDVPWYPTIVGEGAGETESRVGKTGRFCTAAYSEWQVEFER